MIIFGQRLKELRKNKSISQKEFAEYLGITVRQLQRYEANKQEPNLERLIQIADYFDVSLDYLVGRSDNPKRY